MLSKNLPRILIYGVLLIAAFFFLAPLYVMLATSFKDAEQIRSGNLLSLPFNDGLLYIEPVYIRGAGQDSYPLLQKVLAGFGSKVAFKDTLGEALAAVLGTSTSPPTGGENGGTSNPSTDQTTQQRLAFDIARAQDAYNRGQAALVIGDFTKYGEAQKDLKKYLDDAAIAQKLLGGAAPSPSPSPSSSASPSPSSATT